MTCAVYYFLIKTVGYKFFAVRAFKGDVKSVKKDDAFS
jgi:hypothetical protein